MLELYQSESCPTCASVREELTELGLTYVIHNPRLPRTSDYEERNAQTHAQLRELGGEDRIPFLVDTATDDRLYGDDAILEHLRTHYADD